MTRIIPGSGVFPAKCQVSDCSIKHRIIRFLDLPLGERNTKSLSLTLSCQLPRCNIVCLSVCLSVGLSVLVFVDR